MLPVSTYGANTKNEDTNLEPKDSGIDTDYSSDMESVTSGTYAHRYGKRRFEVSALLWLTIRYHGVADNPYPLPNDELEKDRLNALQTCFYLLLRTNIVAPIVKNPTQISSCPFSCNV
jgi:hypothetical protein